MIQIADHIEFAEPIEGEGQFYKAWRSDKQVSAIQVFPFPLSRDGVSFFNEQAALLNEAINGDHAAIPTIRGWGFTKTGGVPYLEMEWTEGYDLTKLKQYKAITIGEIASIAEQISRVLTYCHNLGLVHGNLNSKYILWDEKRERYVLTGFRFGIEEPQSGILAEGNSIKSEDTTSVGFTSQQNDIYALGLLLFRLLKDHLLANDKIDFWAASSKLLAEEKLKDGTVIPAWMVTCIDRALSRSDEERFRSASEMYHYILLYHKTPFQKKQRYRSKPQPFKMPPERRIKTRTVASEKMTSLVSSGLQRGRQEMRFVFDRHIALGLVIAGLLAGFSIIAQKRENEKTHLASSGVSGNIPREDSITKLEEEVEETNAPVFTKEKRKTVALKKRDKKKTPVQKAPAVTSTSVQEETKAEEMGAYKVRSKAYFHNQPDEITRRNAFIVHWNNATLRPSKEENEFVYVVFTNHEGQTSKGWLRKKDLIKL